MASLEMHLYSSAVIQSKAIIWSYGQSVIWSKTVCSSNATEHNVCKVSSVSQLALPSIANKSVHSNNVTKRNVHDTSNVRQLIKTCNVTNGSVPVMQVILSFVILILLLILIVIVSQLNLFINFLM